MKPPTIAYLSDIYFEPNAVQLLPELLTQRNIKHPLVVTDKGLVGMGLIARLPLKGFPMFDDIETNPAEKSVLAARDAFQKNKCDGIIAVGGGSPMDCARCTAMMVTHDGPLEQYAFLNGGLPKIRKDKPPVINIPTTAGTGSEVGRAALITLATGRKMAFISPYFYPVAVLCDPLLTLDLPPLLTAATGMDAICHCLETYCSPKFNPVAEAIGLDGLERGYRAIVPAVKNGKDLAARTDMLVAALEGGLSLQKGLGLVHSLSHPLGGLQKKRLHHGTLNAIFLPHVLRFNMDSCKDKMDRIAHAVGLKKRAELPDVFSRRIAEIGLPLKLSELGVTEADCEALVPIAFGDHCTATNPRPATAEDCRMLFRAAL
jgi:4-hydroxybutyrate dehydrogenase